MTALELKDYLQKWCENGKADALVITCDDRENPMTDGLCVNDILYIESLDGECQIVLQTG